MIFKFTAVLGVGCIALILIPLLGRTHSEESLFAEQSILVQGESLRYRVFVPSDWDATATWPVILFLHGAGERGSDGIKQTQVGLGPAIRRNPEQFRAIVVMPQCRRGVWWNDPAMESMVLTILERSIAKYRGDPGRIYLTGISMGGYGTLYLAAKYPGKFAALVPVCGGVVPPRGDRRSVIEGAGDPYQNVARRIRNTPIWVFHGSADPVVPVNESRRLVRALEEQGSRVRYTEYARVGHNSWDRAYSEKDLIPWMLAQATSD